MWIGPAEVFWKWVDASLAEDLFDFGDDEDMGDTNFLPPFANKENKRNEISTQELPKIGQLHGKME